MLRGTAHSRNSHSISSPHFTDNRLPACQPCAATDLYSIQLFLLSLQLVNIKNQPTNSEFLLVKILAYHYTSVLLAVFDWLTRRFFFPLLLGSVLEPVCPGLARS